MEEHKSSNTLLNTCLAIGEYYKLMGKYYFKKFRKWFEEEDMDVNDLHNDFSHIDQCCYLEFDEEFPFPHFIHSHKEQIQFKIMQYCCYHLQSPTLQQIDSWYSEYKHKKHETINYPMLNTATANANIHNINSSKPPLPIPAFNNSNSLTEGFEPAKILPIAECSNKKKQKYRAINNQYMHTPDLLQIQKTKSYITDDIDLHYKPNILPDSNHLKTECSNVKKCKRIKNIKYILKLYSIWISNHIYKGIYQVFYENNRNISDILSDFYHILYAHRSTFDAVFDELTENSKKKKCDIFKCNMVKRNYRNRIKMAMPINRSKMYNGFEASQEVNMQQLLDKIHCHLLHSYDLGLMIHSKDRNLTSIKRILEEKQQRIEKIYKKLQITPVEKYLLRSIEKKTEEKHDLKNDICTFGDYTVYANMAPKYRDLKEEMLQKITKYQWRDLYYKARDYMNVRNCVQFKGYEIQHLLCCMIWCNYGKWLKIQKTDYSYGNLMKLITETIELCHFSENATEIRFYVCLPKEIIVTPVTQIRFQTLVSVTSNAFVGLSFSRANNGLLLEFEPSKNYKYFDCRFVSDFANDEILCLSHAQKGINMDSKLEISNILDVNIGNNYWMYVTLIKIMDSVSKIEICDRNQKNIGGIELQDIPSAKRNSQINNDYLNNISPYLSHSLDRFCLVRPYYVKQDLIDLLNNIFFLPKAITHYTPKDYEVQCFSDDNCNTFLNCECVTRIVHILKIYQTILNSPFWLKLPILPFVTFDRNGISYDHQQIVSDFSHIMTHHQTEVIQQNLTVFHFVENEIILECKHREITNNKNSANKIIQKVCVSFERHCRNKSYRDLEKEHYLKEFYKINTNETDIIEREMDIESELDRIHAFFLHSLCKYNLIDNIDQTEFDYRKRAIRQSEQDRIRYRAGTIDDYTHYYHQQTISDNDVDKEYLLNNMLMNEKMANEADTVTESKSNSDTDNTDNKVVPLGKFYFQSIPAIEQCLNHIRPTFSNIKEEVLMNNLESLTISDWNEVLRKSKKQTKDWNKKKHKIGYKKVATLKEIMTIKLYTDYDKLQHELKKSFRIIPEKLHNRNKWDIISQMETLRMTLSNFYHWRESMLSTIESFEDFISYESLYHGVNPAMILSPLNTLLTFRGPLSSTTNKHVASTFATNKGMVIQFANKYPLSNFCYQFDASIISDYPEENERIIGFMYCRIRMVYSDIYNLQHHTISSLEATNKRFTSFQRLSDTNMRHNQTYMNWYYWVLRLFTSGIYSMSSTIEPFFIEILQATLEFMRTNNIKNFEDVGKCIQISEISNNKNILILVSHLLKYLFNPSSKQVIYIDDISVGLQEYFLQKQSISAKNDRNWRISYYKLLNLFPKIRYIYLYNHFVFDDSMLKETIAWLRDSYFGSQIIKIKYIYFDYRHISDVMHDIKTSTQLQLNDIGWSMTHKRLKNDNGYAVQLISTRK